MTMNAWKDISHNISLTYQEATAQFADVQKAFEDECQNNPLLKTHESLHLAEVAPKVAVDTGAGVMALAQSAEVKLNDPSLVMAQEQNIQPQMTSGQKLV